MNKKQRKILLEKIVSIAFILILVIVGLISIPIISISGDKLEKENNEWYSNPQNKDKIEKATSKSTIAENKAGIYQNENLKLIKSLKIDITGWKLMEEHYDDKAGMIQLTNDAEDYFNILYNQNNIYDGLEEYSQNQNKKIIGNLKKQGLVLSLAKSTESIIKERLSLVKIYETYFEGERKPYMVVMCTSHQNYYYAITYPTGSEEVSKLFDNFSFED